MKTDTRLLAGLTELGIPYTGQMLEQLETYYEMMIEKNKVMNLTAVTEKDEVITKHFLDSLCFAKVYMAERKEGYSPKIIDIGTGAGFPGIPLKIFFPEIQIVLLDSLQKRINFLQDIVSALGLDGISCVHGRAEELSGKAEYREKFDYAVSRAVARLASLSELCVPFVREGGQFLAYKSEGATEEIDEAREALSTLGCKKVEILSYSIPQSDLPRKMVVASKTAPTPAKYPRGGGKPMKQPIGVKKQN